MNTSPLRVGLTGGIGSGKSTVASIWQSLGAVLIDTDAISRSLTAAGGAALPAIAEAFGSDVVTADGGLDRERMRSLVFSDASARQRLEGILHPMIGQQTSMLAQQAGAATIVFDVPLLAESARWRSRVDRILVIDCPEETQVRRVCQRSAWSEAMVREVIRQQASRQARRAIADAVIFNDGLSLSDLEQQVQMLWAQWGATGKQGLV